MPGVPDALSVIVTVVALLAGLGSAAAFLSAGRQGARLTALRGDVNDRDKRITFLEAENERHEETEKSQAEVISHLRAEVSVLRDLVTGAAGPTAALTEMVAAHHQAAMAGQASIQQGVDDLLALSGNKRTGGH